MSEFFLAFQFGNRGAQTKTGGYPYQNKTKHSSVTTKINQISVINDRQNESRRETQLQN